MDDRGHTNGAEQSQSGQRFPQHLGEAGRQIRDDAQNLVSHVSEAGGELQSYVTEMVQQRPLGTLAVAAGVGYLLGGGLSSRLTVLALGVGTRFAMAVAARELGSWAQLGQSGGMGGQQRIGQGGQQGQGQQGQQGQQSQGQQGQQRQGQQGQQGGQSRSQQGQGHEEGRTSGCGKSSSQSGGSSHH